MESYKVVFKPSVEKDMERLPSHVVDRVLRRIELLETAPVPKQSAKLEGSEALYRLRVGDYRIIYGIESRARMVVIHHVRHRREAYRGLK